MKLLTYLQDGTERVGALSADGSAVLPLPYPDMNTLIETASLPRLRDEAEAAGEAVPLSAVTLCAPIPRPRRDVLCLGKNYLEHVKETAAATAYQIPAQGVPTIYFSKRVFRAVDPDAPIDRHPGLVRELDYEGELAVILSRTVRGIRAADAESCIFGYTILNDVSARDLQLGHEQWHLGKSLDGFTPMGPWIVTADELPFPLKLELSTRVNGELRQHANTEQMIHSLPEILEDATAGMTLSAATIIATGTPSGVGMGFSPPRYLNSGDVVEITVQGIGTLRNPIS